VHCGFCLPACPTYRATGSELDSPRGRIYLVKQLVEGGPIGETTRMHLDRCLTCRACETACPSGVQYGRLLDIGRELVENRVAPRPPRAQWLRDALAETLSRRSAFGMLLALGRWLRPVLPRRLAQRVPVRSASPGRWPAARHARRMIVLQGCVQPALAPQIDLAATRVLDRIGVSPVRLDGEACCGALHHHLGRTERALVLARRNVDACIAALDAGAEAIVSTTSGCGVMVRDYAHLLRDDADYAAPAARVSAATRDLSEVFTSDDLRRAGLAGTTGASVAWQAPCTLQHGQRVRGTVEALLTTLGCRLTHVRDATQCCGSAGTYSILQPELSLEIRSRKLAALGAGEPEVIATANIGCLEHLRAGTATPVKHWIEIVAAGIEP
jgi:glycolate oxidase iron-sulfur subunit